MFVYHNNHLATPEVMTDESGSVVWKADYLPFGKAEIDPASTITNDFRFPGQTFDSETGYHYNWNRYYDPETGRYLTADPIGLAGGINLYGYVGGDPVNRIDPKGLSALTDIVSIIPVFGTGYNFLFDPPGSNDYDYSVEMTL